MPARQSSQARAEATWRQVIAWRLDRHALRQRVPLDDWPRLAARLCGLHAQLASSAELTLWARVDGLERGAVAKALWEDRTLVKTWAMRGTLHLMPAAEFGLWQGALSTYRHMFRAGWLRGFGVTARELEILITTVAEALDGPPRTRDELADAVTAGTGSPQLGDKLRGSWGALLKPVAYRGYLCFAPGEGTKVRFTRPDRWLGPWEPADPDEAMREVARRYLAASGPATREDLGRWWGLTPAASGRLLAGLGSEVALVDVEGDPMWLLAADVPGLTAAAAPADGSSVRLLPAFDQYVVAATRHADRLLPPGTRARVYRTQGWLSPVLLVDGRMAGVWRHERTGSRVSVQIEAFGDVGPTVRAAAQDEAARLGAWFGTPPVIDWIG